MKKTKRKLLPANDNNFKVNGKSLIGKWQYTETKDKYSKGSEFKKVKYKVILEYTAKGKYIETIQGDTDAPMDYRIESNIIYINKYGREIPY